MILNSYLPHSISDTFHKLDGSDIAEWLRGQGYDVVSHKDTGRNGEAVTACGIRVSSNGWVSKA